MASHGKLSKDGRESIRIEMLLALTVMVDLSMVMASYAVVPCMATCDADAESRGRIAEDIGTPYVIKSSLAFDDLKLRSVKRVVVNEGVAIPVGAFQGCGELVEVILPKGIKVLPQWAFKDCSSLVHVEIPESVEIVDVGAFQACSSLESLYLPKNVQHIGDRFRGCSRLSGLFVAEENPFLQSISGCVYDKSASVLLSSPKWYNGEIMSLPPGVRRITSGQFVDTHGLKRIILPSSLCEIGQGCFAGDGDIEAFEVATECRGYLSRKGILYSAEGRSLLRCPPALADVRVEIPIGVEGVEDGAFSHCKNIREIVLPSSVKRLPREAFYRCANLKEVTIPGSLESIGVSCFLACPNLSSIKVIGEDGPVVFRDGFLYDRELGCLYYCAPLLGRGDVRLPDGILKIGDGAFNNLAHKARLVIPKSVRYASSLDILNCESIDRVVFEGDPPIGFGIGKANHRISVYVDLKNQKWQLYERLVGAMRGTNIFVYDWTREGLPPVNMSQ